MMQQIRRKQPKPRAAAGKSRPPMSLKSAQSFGVPAGRIVYLQRTIGNKAVGAIVASHLKPREISQQSPAQLIRREVAYDESRGCYFSSFAPELTFNELSEAQEFDSVLDTLNRYESYIDMPLGQLDQRQRGRLQSFRTSGYPSWLPEKFRRLPAVQKRYQTVAHKIEQKRQELLAANKPALGMSRSDALTLCGLLKRHQISGAATLEKAVQTAADGGPLFGYLFQVHDSIDKLSKFQLSAVEVEYGEANPRTRQHPRADYEMMERLTQEEETSFYSSQFDMREKTFVDDKVGYKQATGPAADGLHDEYNKYAGTATDAVVENGVPVLEGSLTRTAQYGGIDGKMHYKWFGAPPEHFTEHVRSGMARTRSVHPPAFASGLTVSDRSGGHAQTLAEPSYDVLAQKFTDYITDYLISQDVYTQLPYIPWRTAKGTMSFDTWKLHILSIMKDYAIPFPTF